MKIDIDIEKLVNDRKAFDKFVYLPIEEAIVELNLRRENPEVKKLVDSKIGDKIPSQIADKKIVALFRHIATPNYEIRRFINIADALEDFQPIILEYLDDKFNNRNDWKYSLGKLSLYKKNNKKGEPIFENNVIIDFNTSNNKPISEVRTIEGKLLVDVHHDLFFKTFSFLNKDNVLDLSKWLKSNGHSASHYYKSFLMFFLQNGILLENFLCSGIERKFTQEVILPTIIEIIEETGLKPIIVALEPTDIEGEQFWLSHPHSEELSDLQ